MNDESANDESLIYGMQADSLSVAFGCVLNERLLKMKYVNTDVVFQEIPDEVTLAINISNCPCRCPGCHSKFLWADRGEELDENAIDRFVAMYGDDITCISFMGGDADPERVNALANYIRQTYSSYKIGWYTGKVMLSPLVEKDNFDYIKVGPYIAHLGPLKSNTTNQRMYRLHHPGNTMEDITSRFWKR